MKYLIFNRRVMKSMLRGMFMFSLVTIVMLGLWRIEYTQSLLTGGASPENSTLATHDWEAPSVPGQIGWTTEIPPVSDFETGTDLDDYVTCDDYWHFDGVANTWGESTDNLSGLSHYIRNVYRAADPVSAFSLIHSSNPTDQYAAQASGVLAAEAVYEVEIAAEDNAGNTSAFTPRCRLTVDDTAPVSAASYAGTTPTNNTTIDIDYSATDNVAMVDTVSLYYRYEPLGGGGFGAWTMFSTDDVADALAVAGSFVVDTSTLSNDGVYEFYTIGIDLAGNVEAAPGSADTSVTVDSTLPPAPAPVVTNSPSKSVNEEVSNGGFEADLSDWTSNGDVAAVTSTVYASPHSGSKMARIGESVDLGNSIEVNILSQDIPKGVRSIGFYYNFFTKENPGIDDPGMMVFVNDKQVQQIWATDIIDPANTCSDAYCTGWQYMNVYVGDVEDATLSIAFYSGNMDLLGAKQSWLYLDDVSTSDIVVNSSALFSLDSVQDSGTTIKNYYKIGSDGANTQGDSFSIDSQPTDGIISYWSQDLAGNKSPVQTLSVIYDDLAPASITDLDDSSVADLGSGEYSLSFTAPSDNIFPAVSEYELRYAVGNFDASVDWNALQKADSKGPVDLIAAVDGLGRPLSESRAPRMAGKTETILAENLLEGQQYYFAVKSKDAANNWSAMSTVGGVNIGSTPIVDISDSPIVINEFLPDPVGTEGAAMPDGEWVELYNNSDTAIDLSGWVLYDSNDSHALPINTSNSDNNLDTSDAGETIVPAFGYLTVYRNGDSDFSLNQDVAGDSVRLYDAYISTGILIDSHDYTGPVPEGKSIAREYEGVGMFIDPEPTPGRKNAVNINELDPSVKLYKVNDTHARISIFDGQAYDSADYSVLYTRDTAASAIKEALESSVAPIDGSRVDINDIYFGTCSSGGVTCVDHLDISDVSVGVELLKADGTSKTVETEIEGAW
ncbi:MAG: lamin tail domain-containing protein [Patescibacteria group bacterium]